MFKTLKSIFFENIMSQTSNANNNSKSLHTDKAGRFILYMCDSLYQMINVLNIKLRFYPNTTADLIITSSTALADHIEKIEQLNIFHKIIISEYNARFDFQNIIEIPVAERTLHPEKFGHMPKLRAQYTDFFIPSYRNYYSQMIYYYLTNVGTTPAIHIYDADGSIYADNLKEEYRVIDHNLYPEDKRFATNTADIFLYRPDLYCGSSKIPMTPIPPLSLDNTELADILSSIFGTNEFPTEKYLFFNEAFAEDAKVSNEIQILDAIAAIIGKDNIAIIIHIDSAKMEDIYRLHGYHTFSDNGVPWELIALSSKIENKVLMSISSNAIWTPWIITGKACRSVSLLNVMKLSKKNHARTCEYQMLLCKIQNMINQDETFFYRPSSLLELKNVIRYIEGESY